MTPRPGFVPKRRPLSAIFLGEPSTSSSSSPSSLPDLPEPPSPGAESIDSNQTGLPSPPATNSTGSGGGGSVGRRMSSPGDEDYDDEGEVEAEAEATARFARRQSSQATADNAAALQRVMSLRQRNRMAMEKLSRLNSPSPSPSPSARSPLPPLSVSGSETERERPTCSSDELSLPTSQRTPRKNRESDVATAALAAVASMRTSPTTSPRKAHRTTSSKRHSDRWQSEDLSAAPMYDDELSTTGRRQAATRRRHDLFSSTSSFDPRTPQTAPPAPRPHTSHMIDRNREGIGIQTAPRTASRSSPSDMHPPPLRAPNFTERTYGSPRHRPREQTPTQSSRPTSSADEQCRDHLRLASEALGLFDTQLSRLGDSGQVASTVVPDVFRDAQALVRFADQLNGMLRTGTNRALERQIEEEVEAADPAGANDVDMVVLWQDVGADFRDCLRSSDELVRTMSNFLLGTGKLLKELKNQRDAALGDGAGHGRGYSLDSAHDTRSSGAGSTNSRTGSGSGVLDGRRSVDSRRSLDAARAEREVRSASRTEARRSLQLRRERESTTSSKSPEPLQPQRPSPRQPSSSMRRITITPRETENRSRVAVLASPGYDDDDDDDPSPTPPARIQNHPSERLRHLAPIAIPRPLEHLPSEIESGARSAIRRVSSAITSSNRRKTSTTSNMTVRPQPAFAVPPTPGATTALTPATANSRHNSEKMTFPSSSPGVSRHASDSNPRTGTWRNVTFSRATAASANRDRKRTISATSGTSPAEVTDAHAYAATPVYTGRTAALRSERERGSASDGERVRPATLSRRAMGTALARASLDEERAPSRTLGRSSERRRTLTEVFAPH